MSIWREIWKEAVYANQQMITNNDLRSFSQLLGKYPADGMVFYEMAEAFETLEYYSEAIDNYKKAQELLPVPHWKDVAKFAINRVKTIEPYYVSETYEEFYKLQWNSFHKMHTFKNLLPDCRFLGISSLSRIDSEPSSEIVHFRTAMEMEIKSKFPNLVSPSEDNICLAKVLNRLVKNVDWEIICDMDNIRIEGNSSAHENKYKQKYLSRTIESFITVMDFFENVN